MTGKGTRRNRLFHSSGCRYLNHRDGPSTDHGQPKLSVRLRLNRTTPETSTFNSGKCTCVRFFHGGLTHSPTLPRGIHRISNPRLRYTYQAEVEETLHFYVRNHGIRMSFLCFIPSTSIQFVCVISLSMLSWTSRRLANIAQMTEPLRTLVTHSLQGRILKDTVVSETKQCILRIVHRSYGDSAYREGRKTHT